MKNFRNIAALLLLSGAINSYAGTGLKLAQGKKNIRLNDAVAENSVRFLSSAPVENIEGSAKGVQGSFVLDADNLENSTGTITVEVKSMKTGITKRDDHMYAKDWLDADAYPKITYNLKKLSDIKIKSDNGRAEIFAIAEGDFTLHGVTNPIKANININYVLENADTKKKAEGDLVKVKATFTVPLKDFKIAGKQGIVGSKVGETIAIDASLYGTSK